MDASKIIDEKIATLGDWRGALMKQLRKIIHEADPEIVEEWKWMGTPVWNHDGIVCLVNAHKEHVKMTFQKGAKLPDPQKVFNADLNGNSWRAIDWHQGDAVNVAGLKDIIKAAVALNMTKPAGRKPTKKSGSVTAKYLPGGKNPSASPSRFKKKSASAVKKKAPAQKAAAKKASAKAAPRKKSKR